MRRLKRLLIVVLVAALLVTLSVGITRHIRCRSLLQAVGLENGSGFKRKAYDSFTDFLQYVDGYEIAVFTLPADGWNVPKDWIAEPASMKEIPVPVELNQNVLSSMGMEDLECSAWFFRDDRDGVPFEKQEYTFACYGIQKDTEVVLVYRGHHLYGI